MFTRILALLITSCACAGAFLLSFYALSELAADYGVPKEHAWVWALVVDLSILGGTTARLKMRESNFARMIFISATAVSVAGNTVHALPFGPVGIGIAVFPPLAVLGLFEVCVKLLQNVNTPGPETVESWPETTPFAAAPTVQATGDRAAVTSQHIDAPALAHTVSDSHTPAAHDHEIEAQPLQDPAAATNRPSVEPPVWLNPAEPATNLAADWPNLSKSRPRRRPRTQPESHSVPETV
nr:DUF2637 domain-containing protein [Rhodococcus sp. (in: high G+C Gram-positive bacteria)]